MSEPIVPGHIGEQQILAWLDGEISGSGRLHIETHLAACAQCRQFSEELREAGNLYERFHRDVLKPALPNPPKPWLELPPAEPVSTFRPALRWLAASAAMLLAILTGYRLWQTPKVSAAEILQRAERRELPAGPRARIRIQARGKTYVRAASLRAAPAAPDAGPELRLQFTAAHYDWQEPLSVHSYAAWRGQTNRKAESVELTAETYLVHTSSDGALQEATLVLRRADLHPVRGIFVFEPENPVEISEITDDPVVIPPTSAKPAPPLPPPAPTKPTDPVSLELRVFAALHGIGADLGDPIEIQRRDDRVEVIATGLTNLRRQQVAKVLAPLEAVELRFDDPPAQTGRPARRAGSTPAAQEGPLRQQLEHRLGSRAAYQQFMNEALDASDELMTRAYALRALASRFPTVPESDRELLESLRRDHAAALGQQWQRLSAALTVGFPQLANRPAPQAKLKDTQALFNAAQRVDQALGTLASPETLLSAFRDLEEQIP